MIFEVTVRGTEYEIKVKGQPGCYETYVDGMLILDRCMSVEKAREETIAFLKNSGIKEVVK